MKHIRSEGERVYEIDLYRGISIVLMVYFTLNWRLSHALPSVLVHNDPSLLRPGDLVLPLFLFASGMALTVTVERSRSGVKWHSLIRKCAVQWGVGLSLGRAVGHPLGTMDEIVLNALLFPAGFLLARRGEAFLWGASAATVALYLTLFALELLPPFERYYLGGYPGALFYLPVMAAGYSVLKHPRRAILCVAVFSVLGTLIAYVIPPRKLSVTPSFIGYSCAITTACAWATRGKRSLALEYIGARPLRFWILLFVAIVIPLNLYNSRSRTLSKILEAVGFEIGEPLVFGWVTGNLFALLSIAFLAVLSLCLDRVTQHRAPTPITMIDPIQ
jgi:hypothetical protein